MSMAKHINEQSCAASVLLRQDWCDLSELLPDLLPGVGPLFPERNHHFLSQKGFPQITTFVTHSMVSCSHFINTAIYPVGRMPTNDIVKLVENQGVGQVVDIIIIPCV
jgi:hypothetical protein